MVTAKFTIAFERGGERQSHESTREEAEALYAELGRALGKGVFTCAPSAVPIPSSSPDGPWEYWSPPSPLRGTTGDPLPQSPWRITCNR